MRTLLEIKDDGSVAITHEDNGITVVKEVTLGDVAKLFYSLVQDDIKEGKWFSTSVLPPEVIAYGENEKGEIISVVLPWGPGTLPFIYYTTVFQAIPYPRLVFKFILGRDKENAEYRFIRTYVAAVIEKGNLHDDTPLYHYPFSHVSGTLMCTGNAVFPTFKSLFEVATKLPRLILTVPNENDSYTNDVNASHLPLRELLQVLDGQDEFPCEWLSPLKITLGEFCSPSSLYI